MRFSHAAHDISIVARETELPIIVSTALKTTLVKTETTQ